MKFLSRGFSRSFGIGLFLGLLLLAAAGYWSVLQDPEAVLAFNDGSIEFALSPMFSYPRAMVRIWDNGFFFGAGSGQYPVSFVGLGETLFGPHHYRRLFPAVILALAGLGMYWALRSFRLSRPVCALMAGIAMLSAPSFHFAMVGLSVRPIAMACAFLAVGFAERGRFANRSLPYAIGGGCLGLGVTEVPDVGALYALTAAGLIVWTHAAACRSLRDAGRMLARLVLLVAASGLLAYQTIDNVFQTQIRGVSQGVTESTPEERYNWATQWSLPKAESWSIVSGSYFGSSMRSEKSPYWGRVGREPRWDETREGYRNFTMTGWGMSAVASFLFLSFAFLLIADLKRKTLGHFACRSLAVASLTGSVLALMLSWGRHFPLYRLFYALPYFSTIRNPEKWNGPFVLCAVIGGALILDRVWTALRTADRDEMGRLTRALAWAGATLGIAAFAVLVFTITTRDLKLEQLLREDYGALAMRAVEHSVWVSWKTLLLLVAAAAGTLVFLRADRRGKFSAAFWLGGLALLAVGDLLYTNAFFVQPHRYRVLTKPNPLVETLEKAGPDRRLKLLPPRHPLLNNLRLTLLPIPGFDLFDPVSVSRMPDDYAAFFKALESNPIRLWELGAVRFFLSFPDAQAQLDAMDGGRKRFVERAAFGVTVVDGLYVPTAFAAPQDRMLRLLEFTGALPKYRWVPVVESLPATAEGAADILRRMAAPEFDPAETVFVHGEAPSVSQRRGATGIRLLDETPVEARMEVELDSPAFMVRAVRYDSNWEVRADGTPLELLRVNALFQGVVVPAGRHTLVWSYRPPLRPVAVAVAGRLLLLLALLGWVRQGGAPLGGTALENHRLLDAALRSLRERSFGSFL